MNGAYARICGWLATLALLGIGCGQILGLDEYVLVDPGAGGTGGSGGAIPACGDGVLDSGESCDDGNQTGGDGCTSCMVDACYTCAAQVGAPSICKAKTAGDLCAMGLCDGAGKCVECLANAHCGNGGYCFENTCARCNDTLRNGDETDIDCGGMYCNPCSNGKACHTKTDCATTFCTDGVCCEIACDVTCVTCNLAGFVGECTFIEKYGDDPSDGIGESCLAMDGKACSGVGTCLKVFGQPCASGNECITTRCGDPDMDGAKTCVKATGEPCSANDECFSNACTNDLCAM